MKDSFSHKVFNKIKLKIPNVKLESSSDTYFVFDIPTIDFTINDTKGWLYRLWMIDKERFLILGHPIELIDKFKPNRTIIEVNNIDDFVTQVNFIKHHPKDAFVAAYMDFPFSFPSYQIDSNGFSIGYQKIWDKEKEDFVQDVTIKKDEFIEKHFIDFWNNKRKLQQTYNKLQQILINEFYKNIFEIKGIVGVGIFDMRNVYKNRLTSPRYAIQLVAHSKYFKSNKFKENIFPIIDKVNRAIFEFNKTMRRKFQEYYSWDLTLLETFDFNSSFKILRKNRCQYIFVKNILKNQLVLHGKRKKQTEKYI